MLHPNCGTVFPILWESIIWRKLLRKTWRPTCSRRIRFAQTVHRWPLFISLFLFVFWKHNEHAVAAWTYPRSTNCHHHQNQNPSFCNVYDITGFSKSHFPFPMVCKISPGKPNSYSCLPIGKFKIGSETANPVQQVVCFTTWLLSRERKYCTVVSLYYSYYPESYLLCYPVDQILITEPMKWHISDSYVYSVCWASVLLFCRDLENHVTPQCWFYESRWAWLK